MNELEKAIEGIKHASRQYAEGKWELKTTNNYIKIQTENILAWRDKEVKRTKVQLLEHLEPPEQFEKYAKLMGDEECRLCGFNAIKFKSYIQFLIASPKKQGKNELRAEQRKKLKELLK